MINIRVYTFASFLAFACGFYTMYLGKSPDFLFIAAFIFGSTGAILGEINELKNKKENE